MFSIVCVILAELTLRTKQWSGFDYGNGVNRPEVASRFVPSSEASHSQRHFITDFAELRFAFNLHVSERR
jgi:hypothetical protein